MPSMSYCRFENAYNDLQECDASLEGFKNLSKSEQEYAVRLLKLCRRLAECWREILDDAGSKG